MSPEPDWDWDALFDQITSLAVLALLLDKQQLNTPVRRLALERMKADAEEAAEIAGFLNARARAKEGIES
ncbi:hypothetical protein [Streptomyces sp. NPDC059479]|uniref:hypothetical protein n=1 Tax=Streptomyces sp. NPDC059479 TaxID=3346848 RepID=UPI0036C2C119